MKSTKSLIISAVVIVAVLVVGMSASAAIIVNDTVSFIESAQDWGTFDAGGSDKLVVAVAGEHGFPGNYTGDFAGLTYNGLSLSKAVDQAPVDPTHQTTVDIWYLDAPGAIGSGFVINGPGLNGWRATAYALSGTANNFGAVTNASGTSVNLATTVADSLVIAAHGNGGDGNTGTAPTANSPLTDDGGGLWNTRGWGGHGSGHATIASPGSVALSFGDSAADSATVAAAFEPWTETDPPPEPSRLTLGSRVLVSENNQNFNISVFDGKAGYDNTGTTQTNPALIKGTFGDGTVVDYNFFYSPSETIASYAKGAAGRLSDATSHLDNINGNGEDWSDVWTITDPGVDFSTTKDFVNASIPKTFARSSDVSGVIDISGLASGTVYFPHGTYIDQWNLSLTMSGPGQPDLLASDAQTSNGPGMNYGWITDFTFTNPDRLYDTIAYNYFNADPDGSRARFMGVVLDGVVPEPSTFTLAALGLLGLTWFARRRRKQVA